MGYYTRFKLEIVGAASGPVEEINERLHEISDYYVEIDETSGDIKWYDHEKNMKQLSTEYPDIVFKLSGEGEESGDIWESYYKNGKTQYCEAKITYDPYDPYDESKLK